MDALIGTILAGQFRIIRVIGQGGMGRVYLGRELGSARYVAIKVLIPERAGDAVSIARFEAEARAVSLVRHPNVVTGLGFGRVGDGRPFLVMEYLHGLSLARILRTCGALSPNLAICILRQVCAAVAAAHRVGVLHRDLKPDNIFLSNTFIHDRWVKLLDFGVAQFTCDRPAQHERPRFVCGTAGYMSPEQAQGRALDPRCDSYSIGVVAFEMLTGHPPFSADSSSMLMVKHVYDRPPRMRTIRPDLSIDPRLERIVLRALAKKPERRYDSVMALERALGACANGVPTEDDIRRITEPPGPVMPRERAI